MRFTGRLVGLAMLTVMAGVSYGKTLKDESKWVISYTGMYGEASGRLQTPAGGQEGSVTPSEPQFDESGTLSSQLFLGRRLGEGGNHMVFFNFRDWGFEGNDTYQSLPQGNPTIWGNECVVIQNATFCNGDQVQARVDMNWYSLGYGYTFNMVLSGGRNLTVAPWVQADLYRFEMEIDHTEASKQDQGNVDRRYNKGGLRVGGLIEWSQNDWLVWGATALTSVVIQSAPTSLDIEAYAGFRLWDTANTRGNLRLGIGYTYFRYTDQQTVPNDLVAEMGPSPLLSLAVQF